MSPSQRCDEILRVIDETLAECTVTSEPQPRPEAGATAPTAD
jgi:hypothetical protein